MKFTVDAEGWRGETFEWLDPDSYLWAEADALEKVTGHSIGDIEDVKTGLYRTANVSAGRLWLALKRARPETTFTVVRNLPINAVTYEDTTPDEPGGEPETGEAPDPTGPAGDDTGPPSPTPGPGT